MRSSNPFSSVPEGASWGGIAQGSSNARTEFLHKTYQTLALSILGFVGVEALLLSLPGIEKLAMMMAGRWSWMIVLGAFMLVSHVANNWASSAASLGKQYAGLTLFVVAEAVIFVPLLLVAKLYQPDVIGQAAVVTLCAFGGLTATVLISKKDFSFLGGVLRVAGFAALGVIVASAIFGFSLGGIFSWLMVAFAGGAIVYNTSNLVHRFNPEQHVAAALSLFSSVALLFWYVLRLFLGSRD